MNGAKTYKNCVYCNRQKNGSHYGPKKHGKTSKYLRFLSPTNAPLYYTYKMLKYTIKTSYDRSYMFWSTWTIIREPMSNLVKVTLLWR